jgi:hypothetical protein
MLLQCLGHVVEAHQSQARRIDVLRYAIQGGEADEVRGIPNQGCEPMSFGFGSPSLYGDRCLIGTDAEELSLSSGRKIRTESANGQERMSARRNGGECDANHAEVGDFDQPLGRQHLWAVC